MAFRSGESARIMSPGLEPTREEHMIREESWREIHRLFEEEHLPISEIARRFGVDRKTVRRSLRQAAWTPYRRPARTETRLTEHAEYLRARAPRVGYSAQILYQELRMARGYTGSYETVKRFVQPLRAELLAAERTQTRFETEPGHQSQIDWGSARVWFRHQPVELHIFVLTLGYSRRGFYQAYLGETLSQFLDAHERAFDHFGGHTREHLYDRPRTVCRPAGGDSRVIWNPTFRSFADYWGFEPRLCRAYRAQTKGKVESGVKYARRNFLPGRSFIDFCDFGEQLCSWNLDIADVRIHGTTHERPIDRFETERALLVPLSGQPSFRLEARQPRIVASDWLVSLDTNRYSVPFSLIGQTVEVGRRAGVIAIYHRGSLVVEHPEIAGKHQMRILPEHGPGAIARAARQRRSNPEIASLTVRSDFPDVEVRDLGVYDDACAAGGAR